VPEGTQGLHIVRNKATGQLIDLSIDPISGKQRKVRIPLAYDERGYPVWHYNNDGVPVCGARIKSQQGRICLSPQRHRNGRCDLHFGKVKRGIDHQSFKHGKWSKVLPKGMGKDFDEMMNDPDYLKLKDDIALVNTQITQLMKDFEQGTDGYTWKKLVEMADDSRVLLSMSKTGMDPNELNKELCSTLYRMNDLIEKGSKGHRLWNEITDASIKKGKLIDIETKRLLAERNSIPADQAFTLFSMILTIVKRNVRDKNQLRAIAREVDQLAINPAHRSVLSGRIDMTEMSVQSGLGDSVAPEEDMRPSPELPAPNEFDIDHLPGVDDEEDEDEDEDMDEEDEE